jgi:hypothetical protein
MSQDSLRIKSRLSMTATEPPFRTGARVAPADRKRAVVGGSGQAVSEDAPYRTTAFPSPE